MPDANVMRYQPRSDRRRKRVTEVLNSAPQLDTFGKAR